MRGADFDALAGILAAAYDSAAFDLDVSDPAVEMRRRSALGRARAGIRVAQALGWRFLPPGEFKVTPQEEVGAMAVRSVENARAGADAVEGLR